MPVSVSKRFVKPFLVAILLLCFCIALLVLSGAGSELDLTPLPDPRLILPAIMLQIMASLLFIFAWKTLLGLQRELQFSFAECSAHIGVTLLGKYLPGKIWGLLGRSYLLTQRGMSSGLALNLLLADQFVTFYTGIMIGVVALLALYSPALSILLAALACLAFPLSLRYYDRIMQIGSRLLNFLTRKISPYQGSNNTAMEPRIFYSTFVVYTAHWLFTSLVLCLLFSPSFGPSFTGDIVPGIIVITAAIPLAMLLGFVAIWAPGGIGVREGTIVAILALQFPLELALTIAIYYRIICIAIDLVIGAFAVFYLAKKAPWLLAQEAANYTG
ncbi:MAG: lysylphosphatidylglycerol synthase domain-containing protein [Pseudohongiellaceae bacterium]